MLQTRNVELCKSNCFKKKWERSFLIFPILHNTCRYLHRDLTNCSETTTTLWIKSVSVTRQPDKSVLPHVQCSICKLNPLHSNDLPRKRAKQQLNNKSLSSVGNTGSLPIYQSARGSLSAGYHCLSQSRGHLLRRVTRREERRPPENKSERPGERGEGRAGMGGICRLWRELETVN